MGSWDFSRAFVARMARTLPPAEAAREVSARLGVDAEEASAMVEEARVIRPGEDESTYMAPAAVFITPDWFACEWHDEERELDCPIPANPRRLSRFVYRADAPAESQLYMRFQPGRESEGAPAVVVAAGESERNVYEPESPSHPSVGVLVDLVQRR